MRARSMSSLEAAATMANDDSLLITREGKTYRLTMAKFLQLVGDIPGVEGADWVATKTITGGTLYPETYVTFENFFVSIPDFGGDRLVAGREYVVYWNGAEYPAVCQAYDESVYIGNGDYIGAAAAPEYPFCIWGMAGTGVTVYKNGSSMLRVTLRVDEKEGVEYNKLPEEYLPEGVGSIPVFDLSEMGMPPASFSEQMEWVQADLTQLCDALDKGPVKLKYTFDMDGAQAPVWIIAQAMYMQPYNCYMVVSFATLSGAVVMSDITFNRADNVFKMTLHTMG